MAKDKPIELEMLRFLFKTAWKFLKTTTSNEQPLVNLPWYILMGPSQAGKTLLLDQAELNIAPLQHLATSIHDEGENNKRCNWWFNQRAIVLDIPGQYLALENQPTPLSWRNFLSVTRKYFSKKPLAGIVLTLDLPEWAQRTKTEQETVAQHLRQAILLLCKQLKTYCPIHLVLTKMDKINGFNEFFGDLSQEERRAPWGIDLVNTNLTSALSLPGIFKTQFEHLLKRLHSRVIWRIHQERNPQKRALIQHFPWQLENMKSGLASLIYQLGDIFNIQGTTPLRGIYFCSNVQDGTAIDFLPKTQTGILNPNQALIVPPTPQRSAYFTQVLLRKIILRNTQIVQLKAELRPKNNWRKGFYLATSIVILSLSFILAHSFNTKLNKISAAEIAFTNYRFLAKQLPPDNANLEQTLPMLNALQQSVSLIQEARLPHVIQDVRRSYPLPLIAQKTYTQVLAHYFLPGIRSQLETVLAQSNDPNQLYGALQAYLMLNTPAHFDAHFVSNWFKMYWQQTLQQNPELQTKLLSHLTAVLEQAITPAPINQELVTRVRTLLGASNTVALANSVLKYQIANTPFHPLQFDSAQQKTAFYSLFVDAGTDTTIPNMYSASKFQDIFFTQIPKACATIINGDWVLGYSQRFELDPQAKQQLIANVQRQYLQDYANTWQAFLNHFVIAHWQNWSQAQTALNSLATPNSPLTQIINITAANTAFTKLINPNSAIAANDAQMIHDSLSDRFQYLAQVNNDSIRQVQTVIKALQNQFEVITSSTDSDKEAFLATRARFVGESLQIDPIKTALNLANTAPAPLQTWLQAIANNSWQLMIQRTTLYLNQLWQEKIAAFYKDHLQNRYPLYKTSKEDAALNHFTQFFAGDGMINTFYKTYLYPFVDTTHAEWRYRTIDGQSIGFPHPFLAQLERAALIRSMFFAENHKLAVTFSLHPIALEPEVKNFILNVNGQTLDDTTNSGPTPHFLTWPGLNPKQETVTLTFVNQEGKSVTKSENGSWALFRVFDQANLRQSTNSKEFQLTFDLNGYSARYQLMAENAINPFIPGVVEGFRCPLSLVE